MPNTVIISSLAEKELQESFDWYEEQLVYLAYFPCQPKSKEKIKEKVATFFKFVYLQCFWQ